MSDELTALSGSEQARLIESRQISPVDLVKAYLARIECWDDVLRAWITVDGDRALAAARTAEDEIAAGRYRGPLHGIPYGVKDQMHAVGFPTTLATKVLDPGEMVAPCNAAVIERLDQAGAILLGKQNLHEFGKGGTIDFPYGQPRNPWNPAYSASSSSTGSGIAPAARMRTFSLGEDTGGSVRGPAALNGIAGLRPTYGRVSRFGAVMEAYTTDTIGPLARTVADIATVLEVIAGHDARDPLSSRRPVDRYAAGLDRPIKGRRLAIVSEIAWGPGTTDEVKAVFAKAVEVLRALGAEIEEVSLPLALYAVPLQLLSTDADVAAYVVKKYLRERYDRFDTGTRTRLAASSLIPATVYNSGHARPRHRPPAGAGRGRALRCADQPHDDPRHQADRAGTGKGRIFRRGGRAAHGAADRRLPVQPRQCPGTLRPDGLFRQRPAARPAVRCQAFRRGDAARHRPRL